jgi:mono/diheme cytochrome c family protein
MDPSRALPFALALAAASLPALPQSNDARALEAFEVVRSVLQHPRCANCHIPEDGPRQLDVSRPHSMYVRRGPAGRGVSAMQCSGCHGEQNLPASYGRHVPPGAPNWHLPPPETKMVFIDVAPAQLCATIKDRAATGGKDLPAMLKHNREDKLVGWGWEPGLGRNPVPVPREAFVTAFKTWMDLGAPCPR